jgi:hypothetical protein
MATTEPMLETTVHSPQDAFSSVQHGHWEVAQGEIKYGPKIGEGANAVILKATFRGQNCVAKLLKEGTSTNTQACTIFKTALKSSAAKTSLTRWNTRPRVD